MIKLLVLMFAFISFFSYAVEPNYSHNRLIVKIKPEARLPYHPDILSVKRLFGRILKVNVKDIHNVEQTLKADRNVEYVERDYIAKQKRLPRSVAPRRDFQRSSSFFNDPKMSELWFFKDNTENGVAIEKSYVEELSRPLGKVIVAVVDTGIDYNHEDLRDVMWRNIDEVPGNGIDDDQNGYVDDIFGINTLVRDHEDRATVEVMDGHSHGTHVAGTIGATQNNGKGIAGVSSSVALMGIRTVPNYSDEKDVDVIEAFIYAAKNGARIINCSFGKDRNEGGKAVAEAIDHIGRTYGVLVIAAAGNSTNNIDEELTYPASFTTPNLLVVASTTSTGRLSYFSNYGLRSVDVAAPGSNVYSTTPRNGYASKSGTSMASPVTAGVAAEVLANFPHLSPLELKEIIMGSVDQTLYLSNKVLTGGRVNLFKALARAKAYDAYRFGTY